MNPDVQAGTIPYHLLDFEAELTMEQIQEREAADDYGGHRRVMLYTFTRSGRQLLEGCREDGTGEGLVAALDVLKEFKQHLAVLQGMTEAAEVRFAAVLHVLLAELGEDAP